MCPWPHELCNHVWRCFYLNYNTLLLINGDPPCVSRYIVRLQDRISANQREMNADLCNWCATAGRGPSAIKKCVFHCSGLCLSAFSRDCCDAESSTALCSPIKLKRQDWSLFVSFRVSRRNKLPTQLTLTIFLCPSGNGYFLTAVLNVPQGMKISASSKYLLWRLQRTYVHHFLFISLQTEK